MQITHLSQHGSLTAGQEPLVKPPSMHSELLLVQVTNLKHAILSKEGVCMVPPLHARHQPSKPLLIPEK